MDERALSDYSKAIERAPKSAHAYNSRGVVYDMLGELWSIVADFNPHRARSNRAVGVQQHGYAYKLKGDIERALPDYDKAIALDPRCVIAYINRGIAYYRKDQYDVAIEDFTKAIENEAPAAKLGVPYINRGHCWFMKRETERALADYNRSIALDPADAGAYAQRASLYEGREDYARAIADYTTAPYAIEPQQPELYVNRGVVSAAQDQALIRAAADFLPRLQAVVGTRAAQIPFGASCISASVWPSGSVKNAIQRSWSSIFAIRCGLDVNDAPRLISSLTASVMSAQRK